MTITAMPMLASLVLASPQPGHLIFDAIVQAASSASEASMHIELFVAPKREILSCRMIHVEPGGAPVERVCKRLQGKKVSKAGKGKDGQPIHAALNFVFTLDGVAGYRAPPDYSLVVSDWPEGAKPESVWVGLLVDKDGLVTDCGGTGSASNQAVQHVCPQLIGRSRNVRVGAGGTAVDYLEVVEVELAGETTIDQ